MSVVGDTLRETGNSLGTVFRNPGLRRLNLGFAGSSIGDWAYATAITVWAYSVGGVAAVGIWGTTRYVLMALIAPFAATLADRFPRKKVMIVTDLIRGSIALVCAVLIFTEAPPIFVFVLATVSGLAAAPFRPSLGAIMPSLANSPTELTAANGTISTLESLAFFVGPAIGGVLLTIADIPVVIVFNALTFFWSALMVSGIKVHAPLGSTETADTETLGEETEEKAVGFLRESMEGFAVIGRDRNLLVAAAVATAQTVVAGASLVFGIEIAVQMTTLGPEGIGYLDSALGVGALIGGLVTIARASAGRIATDFVWGCVFWALPLLLVSIWPAMWPAFVAMFIIGAANPLVDVNLFTMLQRMVDDRVLGRVLGSIEGLQIAGLAIGSALMPLLLLFLDLRIALAVLGIGIAVIVLPAFPRFRRLDAQLREPEGLPRLRTLALFAPLDPKSLERVAQQLKKIEVPAGATVIREGDVGDLFYIVESGALTATHNGEVLSHQGPGDPFGEIALLRDVPRTATVVADVDSTLVYLERDAFLAAVTGDVETANRAEDLVSRRIPTY